MIIQRTPLGAQFSFDLSPCRLFWRSTRSNKYTTVNQGGWMVWLFFFQKVMIVPFLPHQEKEEEKEKKKKKIGTNTHADQAKLLANGEKDAADIAPWTG